MIKIILEHYFNHSLLLMWIYPTYAIENLKSPIGTGHIVAADFNPPNERYVFYRVPSGRCI